MNSRQGLEQEVVDRVQYVYIFYRKTKLVYRGFIFDFDSHVIDGVVRDLIENCCKPAASFCFYSNESEMKTTKVTCALCVSSFPLFLSRILQRA